MKKIGFIGLGIMGLPMAKNIMKGGFEILVVRGHAEKAVSELASEGAKAYDTPAALAAEADVVMLCLPDTPDVLKVVKAQDGLLSAAKPGLVIVDHSTISPSETMSLAEHCAGAGVHFLDAPVSGGDKGAIEGTLSIMIGGNPEAVAKVRPVLEAEGKSIVHVGASGAGQFTKCCNQIIGAVTFQAIAEGMALGAKAGVDPAKMLEAVSAGAARCWALEVRVPRVLEGDFKPGFMARLQLKDLKIALDAGKTFDVPLPVSSVVTSFYTSLVNGGKGDLDTSAVLTVEEELAGVKIRRRES